MKNKFCIARRASSRLTCLALLGSGVVAVPLAQAADTTYAAPVGASASGCAVEVNYGTPTNRSRADADTSGGDNYENAPACATAIGDGATATEGGQAFGSQARANNGLSTAVGPNATAGANGSVALGSGARADGIGALAASRQASAAGAGAVAVGVTSTSSGDGAVGVGYSAQASGTRSVAIGSAVRPENVDNTFDQQFDPMTNTQALGLRSVALGAGTKSFSASDLALGDRASAGTANNDGATANIAIGRNAVAAEGNAVAMGSGASATNPNAIAIGTGSSTNASRTAVVGTNAVSYGDDAVAMGTNARSDGLSSVAIGGGYSTAIDPDTGNIVSETQTTATGIRAVSIGAGSQVEGVDSIGIGSRANAALSNAVAIGNGATAGSAGSVAIGFNSTSEDAVGTNNVTIAGTTYQVAGATPMSTVSIGSAGSERTLTHVAAGRVAATSTDGVNGSQLYATNQAVDAVNDRVDGIGQQVTDLNQGVVQYQNGNNGQPDYGSIRFQGDDGTALHNVANGTVSQDSMDAVNGSQLYAVQQQVTRISKSSSQPYFEVNSDASQAQAGGSNSVAAGPNSSASGNGSVAMGNGAIASSEGGVALGSGSQATRAGLDGGREAVSGAVVNSTAGAVSVGSNGGERQITHVAGGTQDTDAANIRQLRAVQAGSVGYDRGANGNVDYSSITLGNGNGPAQIHNVAPGTSGTDAVNLNQLRTFGNDVNGRFDALRGRVEDYRDDAQAGTASAIAVASIPQATEPGKNMIAGGVGTFMGEGGFAVGVSSLSTDGHWAVKLNGTVDTRGDGGVGGGVGYMW